MRAALGEVEFYRVLVSLEGTPSIGDAHSQTTRSNGSSTPRDRTAVLRYSNKRGEVPMDMGFAVTSNSAPARVRRYRWPITKLAGAPAS